MALFRRGPRDAEPWDAIPEDYEPAASVFSRVTALLAEHPQLPPVNNANVLLLVSPPHIDLWVSQAEHVYAWAQALGTHPDSVTTIEDLPRSSHVITSTPEIVVDGVSYRIVHLRYLGDSAR